MYIERQITPRLREALAAAPVVLVTGPRQSGKTTLVRTELGEATYISLDDPLEREFAREDPNGFLDRGKNRLIIDEVQHVPELLSYVKLRVDEDRRPGRFVLTGSHQFALMGQVSESLAGRVAILELLPLSVSEEPAVRSLADTLWTGCYPELVKHPQRRSFWLPGYIRTYIERDVRQMRQINDLAAFERFVALAAAAHSQEWNSARIARSIGVTKPTVAAWLGLLEAGYLAITAQPYFRNLGKRLVKSPKFYFFDPALVCALTRQPGADAALAGAMAGPLFEGLVVAEAAKAMANAGARLELYHWRSHDQMEVDLIVRTRDGFVPVEIKKTATPKSAHVAPMTRFLSLESEGAGRGLLVCCVDERRELPGGHVAMPWREFGEWVSENLVGP